MFVENQYCGIYNVMTLKKEVNLNVRIRSDVRDDFKIVAELRGISVSGLLHQYMVKLIREEKERDPEAFKREVSNIKLIPGDVKMSPVDMIELGELKKQNKKAG